MKLESRPGGKYYGYGVKRKATNGELDNLNSNPNFYSISISQGEGLGHHEKVCEIVMFLLN